MPAMFQHRDAHTTAHRHYLFSSLQPACSARVKIALQDQSRGCASICTSSASRRHGSGSVGSCHGGPV